MFPALHPRGVLQSAGTLSHNALTFVTGVEGDVLVYRPVDMPVRHAATIERGMGSLSRVANSSTIFA
jgi:hypothetical protein